MLRSECIVMEWRKAAVVGPFVVGCICFMERHGLEKNPPLLIPLGSGSDPTAHCCLPALPVTCLSPCHSAALPLFSLPFYMSATSYHACTSLEE